MKLLRRCPVLADQVVVAFGRVALETWGRKHRDRDDCRSRPSLQRGSGDVDESLL